MKTLDCKVTVDFLKKYKKYHGGQNSQGVKDSDMKIHFYYNEKTIKRIDDEIKKFITNAANSCFRVSKSNIAQIIEHRCTTLNMGDTAFDYICIVDDKIKKDPIQKKKAFYNTLNDFFYNEFKEEIKGMVKIETNHTPIDTDYSGKSSSKQTKSKSIDNDTLKDLGDTFKKAFDPKDEDELNYEKIAEQYMPVEPAYKFDRVILSPDVLEKIEESLNIIEYENKVFKEWGLYEIQPNPSSCLSFFGPSGTGKTMAAEAIADKLHKKILKVTYADIESKFHGEGPKRVKAIFLAAKKYDAVLFIDEADSLLSKRLTNVTQGSEQAINSMRSQLLVSLEHFHGIVIFATNLVVNYDQAFLTRLISVEFKKPNVEERKKIWDVHIRPVGSKSKLNIPLAEDVNTQELAEKYKFCGREIRKSVISACVSAAMKHKDFVSQEDFIKAADKVLEEEKSLAKASDHTKSVRDSGNKLTPAQSELLKTAIKAKLKEQEEGKQEEEQHPQDESVEEKKKEE